MLRTIIKLTFIIFSVFIVLPSRANAYLDPGSGSYVIQIVIASLAGMGLLLKTQWENIRNIFYKNKNKNKEDENN